MTRFLCFVTLLIISCSEPQEGPIFEIIDQNHPLLNPIFDNADKYEVQIRYTQINRDKDGVPSFHTISYREDPDHYFYPASTVKMPAAFLAFEKLNELNEEYNLNLTDSTHIIHYNSRPPQSKALTDSTHHSLAPSLGHYIDKLFVVSDNDAYNRVYEFLAQDYINTKLKEKGAFTNSRIVHRVGIVGFTTDDHRYTNAVDFIDKNRETILSLPAQEAKGNYFSELASTIKGKGYYDNEKEEVIMESFDMSKKNFIRLRDLEASLKRIIFPEVFNESERFNLSQYQYQRLYKSMLKLPKDFEYLSQDTTHDYYDGYVKFFIYGDTKEDIPDHIKIMNKVGYAYGTLTDCAYIIDTQNNVEFLLTATILVNENGIFNDGKYEYEEIGIPFLAELGRQIHFYEISREKKYEPSFGKYF